MTAPAHRMAEISAYYRALDEGAAVRHHFRHADEDGGVWYFEAVPDGGELAVVKQIEFTPAGTRHRYAWHHLEDAHGFLTDQPITPDDPVEPITAQEFHQAWTG
ncbi:hypothetical protein [Streptomyces sp. NPDC002067]